MPIRKEKMARYPGGSIRSKEWLQFRAFIIFRAGNKCEGTPHHPDCRARNGHAHPETGGKVDTPHRKKNAAKTRRMKSDQIDLEDWIKGNC